MLVLMHMQMAVVIEMATITADSTTSFLSAHLSSVCGRAASAFSTPNKGPGCFHSGSRDATTKPLSKSVSESTSKSVSKLANQSFSQPASQPQLELPPTITSK